MPMYEKIPVVVEAFRWFKNGDHPGDNCHMIPNGLTPFLSEGEVVRRYRRPDEGWGECQHCCESMSTHGWIDTLEGGHIVCPGDWIVTGIEREKYPVKNSVFLKTYKEIKDV